MKRGGLFRGAGHDRSAGPSWLGRLGLLVAGCAVLAGVGALLWYVPRMVVDHDLAGAGVGPQDRLTALNDVRRTLLSAIGGAAVLFAGYGVWRQLRVGRATLRATRDGALADRLSRAVEHLGSDRVDVRVGGIHALWRTGEHSPRDREAAIAILATFLRTHTPRAPAAARTAINDLPPLESRLPDAQTALTALGGLCRDRQQASVNLSRTDLRRADGDGLWLHQVNLDRADLEAATLAEANLSWASLVSATLRHATLRRAVLCDVWSPSADLRGVRATEADLRGANLTGADLREADLRRADLREAVLAAADLREADVRGADFGDVDLAATRLADAVADERTVWPRDFDAAAAGVITAPADPAPEADPAPGPPAPLTEVRPLRSLAAD